MKYSPLTNILIGTMTIFSVVVPSQKAYKPTSISLAQLTKLILRKNPKTSTCLKAFFNAI